MMNDQLLQPLSPEEKIVYDNIVADNPRQTAIFWLAHVDCTAQVIYRCLLYQINNLAKEIQRLVLQHPLLSSAMIASAFEKNPKFMLLHSPKCPVTVLNQVLDNVQQSAYTPIEVRAALAHPLCPESLLLKHLDFYQKNNVFYCTEIETIVSHPNFSQDSLAKFGFDYSVAMLKNPNYPPTLLEHKYYQPKKSLGYKLTIILNKNCPEKILRGVLTTNPLIEGLATCALLNHKCPQEFLYEFHKAPQYSKSVFSNINCPSELLVQEALKTSYKEDTLNAILNNPKCCSKILFAIVATKSKVYGAYAILHPNASPYLRQLWTSV